MEAMADQDSSGSGGGRSDETDSPVGPPRTVPISSSSWTGAAGPTTATQITEAQDAPNYVNSTMNPTTAVSGENYYEEHFIDGRDWYVDCT